MIRSHVITAAFAFSIALGAIGGCADVSKNARADQAHAGPEFPASSQEDVNRWLTSAAKSRGTGLFRFGAYDPRKTAVIFINGINGSPTDFKTILAKLDLSTVQPWVYSYSSHRDLGESADKLFELLCDESTRDGPLTITLVGYSIGGLIARDVALHANDESSCARVPTLITLSTPWNGHKGAAWSYPFTSWLPAVWGDLIPGSAYLKHLFVSQPRQERKLGNTAHFLLFSFGRPPGFGRSGDGVVSVASQLFSDAQRQAAGVYGFNLSHDHMLDDANVLLTVENLLEQANENVQAAAF
jgi:pimeloyl-ACP methyl ester carboxylesterase